MYWNEFHLKWHFEALFCSQFTSKINQLFIFTDRLCKKPVDFHCLWIPTMLQGGQAGRQNNACIFSAAFALKKNYSSSHRRVSFCSFQPTWPPWRQLQTSSRIIHTYIHTYIVYLVTQVTEYARLKSWCGPAYLLVKKLKYIHVNK